MINYYSTTNVYPETGIENFHQPLSETLTQIAAQNMVIIGGNFNAKIGYPEVLHSFTRSTSHNRQMLCVHMVQHGLIALNTKFR